MNRFAGSALLGVVLAAGANAQVETNVTLDLASKYVWHGINTVNDWVLQPGVALSKDGFTFYWWGSMELTNWNAPNYPSNPRGRFTEIALGLEYSGSWPGGDWTLGYVDYQFPGTGWERYAEWYAGLAADFGSITVYRGTNSETGTYATLSIEHSTQLAERALDLSAELTYGDRTANGHLYGTASAGFSDLLLTAGTAIEMGSGWSMTPSLNYSTLLKDELLAGQPRRTNIWLNLGFARQF